LPLPALVEIHRSRQLPAQVVDVGVDDVRGEAGEALQRRLLDQLHRVRFAHLSHRSTRAYNLRGRLGPRMPRSPANAGIAGPGLPRSPANADIRACRPGTFPGMRREPPPEPRIPPILEPTPEQQEALDTITIT